MPTPDELVGTIVGAAYRLTRRLGEGGMGTVYEAQHLRLGGKVAIKILSPQYAADHKFRDRFKREARAASQIRHPNVVQITDFGETPSGSVFFAMELLEGHDLHAILREEGQLAWPRAQHLLGQAADALAAAHRCGVVHRDVKPANIFVLEGAGVKDFVKLLDFGIAKILAPAPTADSALVKNLTGTGEIFGTAKYMAPEQAYGVSDDPRVDVYSLGVVAYELLTGRAPFTGQGSFEVITRHVYELPRPLRELRPELPATLEAVVLRALEKQPGDRFATMEDFGRALRTATDSVPTRPATERPRQTVTTVLPAHTDAATLPRHDEAKRPAIEPTLFHRAMPSTKPSLELGAALPVGTQVPAAVGVLGFVDEHPSAASPTQRTSGQPRTEASTGPLVHPGLHEETGREPEYPKLAARSPWRLVAVFLFAAIGVGTLSATAVILALGPRGEDAPTTGHSSAAVAARPEPTAVVMPEQPKPDPRAEPEEKHPTVAAAELVDPAEEPAQPPDLGTALANAEPTVDTPDPPKRKERASTSHEPKSEADLLKEAMRKIKRRVSLACDSLGAGRAVEIKLYVDDEGVVYAKTIDAEGPLARCIEDAIGRPSFPPGKRSLGMKPIIGHCTDPFGKCK